MILILNERPPKDSDKHALKSGGKLIVSEKRFIYRSELSLFLISLTTQPL